MRPAALSVLLLLGMAMAAQDGFDEVLAAVERGDYATALGELRPLAEAGHADAQYALGSMTYLGQGVPQGYEEAVRWWRKAAEQGHVAAQTSIGLCFKEGTGVPQEYGEAVRWWRKAAEQNFAEAQHNLGLMYDDGLGVPQDYVEAVKWWRKAAEQGASLAQYSLGFSYSNGQGVPRDHTEAMKWFHKAAEQGHAEAMINLGVMYHQQTDLQVILSFLFSFLGIGRSRLVKAHMWLDIAASSLPLGQRKYEVAKTRDDMAKEMTPGQIAEAERLALEWMEKHGKK